MVRALGHVHLHLPKNFCQLLVLVSSLNLISYH